MTPETKVKALSEKPVGYVLAVVGGTIGGPIGWITSPLVLFVLNNVMKEKDGKQPNRFLAWSLIGIVGAPLSFAPILSGTNTSTSTSGTSTPPQENVVAQPKQVEQALPATGVNMENYLKLQNGMSYNEVTSILGEEGEELSSNEIAGIKTVMYMWRAKGFSGANMNAMFQDGAMVQKSQFGLK